MEAKEQMQGMLEHAEGDLAWMERSLPVTLRHLQVQTLGTGDINMHRKEPASSCLIDRGKQKDLGILVAS